MNCKNKLIMVVIIILGITAFTGCQKEDYQKQSPLKEKAVYSRSSSLSVDEISKEIADYHGEILSFYLALYENKPTSFNQKSLKDIASFVCNVIDTIDFKYINTQNLEQEIKFLNDFSLMSVFISDSKKEKNDFSFLEKYIPNTEIDLSVISEIADRATPLIVNSIKVSKDYESFDKLYTSSINKLISEYNLSNEEYFCVKVYADVYRNSALTWSGYRYKQENRLCGYGTIDWGGIVKGFYEDVIEPLAKADAKGAVHGAVLGWCSGGPEVAGPAALADACGESIYAAVKAI